MPTLPKTTTGNTLSEEEALRTIGKLSAGKACGPDGIPAEVHEHVAVCKAMLVKLLQKTWLEEDVPSEFVKAVFVMFYKQKGSPNDPFKAISMHRPSWTCM